MNQFKRVIMIVLDSVGVGELPDASAYGDAGSNTLGNIDKVIGGLKTPNLGKLGLGNILPLTGVATANPAAGAFGKMAEASKGKDTTTGHWEIAGILTEKPFPTFSKGFPRELIQEYEKLIGRKTLGNKVASGTVIIDELGEEHLKTGFPIVYTSADSVFQIAAHEEIIPIEQLYEFCRIAREFLVGDNAVGRVIARPFEGKPGSFRRTERRHDYSLLPPKGTLLDVLTGAGVPVLAVGKIKDIFAGQGVTKHKPSGNNQMGVEKTLEFLREENAGLIFTNLVDFDMLYGHRNNPQGYGEALAYFDSRLPEIIELLREDDLLFITADHGCDPTTSSTDHSREYVPLLVYGARVKPGTELGIRTTFADLGATVSECFGVQLPLGTSFLGELGK